MGELAVSGSVKVLEVEQHHLTINRLEARDKREDALKVDATFCGRDANIVAGGGLDLFILEQNVTSLGHLATELDVRGAHVIGDAVNPGAPPALAAKTGKALPQRDMDVLRQFLVPGLIALIASDEAGDVDAERTDRRRPDTAHPGDHGHSS